MQKMGEWDEQTRGDERHCRMKIDGGTEDGET